MSDPIVELERLRRESWQDDLELRAKADNDPELAAIIADADAQYEAEYGKPWVNPLTAS